MLGKGLKAQVQNLVGKLVSPVRAFHSHHYLRHNARRLEHLASLRIPVAGSSVLEVGAGIGDHSHYYIDRECRITITEAREDNLEQIRGRYPDCKVEFLDMETPSQIAGGPFDVIHCYGLLYHLSRPQQALAFLSKQASGLLFLETCVSFGEAAEINPVAEARSDATQAVSGRGCRPTRAWLFQELGKLFEYVYVPRTQPCHEEFPLDWRAPEKHKAALQRAVFVASRRELRNELLCASLLDQQLREA
jgi:Methyltransferase domain